MHENFKMLDRIKKSRSHYIREGPESPKKKTNMAERLADGLVKVPLLLKSIDSTYKRNISITSNALRKLNHTTFEAHNDSENNV